MILLRKLLHNPFFLSIFSALAGGSVIISAKIALEVFPTFTLVALRFLLATLFLLPILLKKRLLSRGHVKTLLFIGFIGAMNPILLFIALHYSITSVSPLIYASVPAMSVVFLFVTTKFKPEPRQLIGILLGFVGVLLVVVLPSNGSQFDPQYVKGNILIFCAAIMFMLYGVYSNKAQKEHHISPLLLTFSFCVVSLIICSPFVLFELSQGAFHSKIMWYHMANAFYMGIVGTGLFYIVYQYAIKSGSAVAASLFTYLQPVVTITLASIFLGEHITLPIIFGGILAIIGARLASTK